MSNGSPNGRASRIAALCVALFGFALSAYLTVEHYQNSTSLACPETGVVNCLKVTTSRWSTIGGISVAVLGLAFYAAMIVLLLLSDARSVLVVRLVGVTAGMAMVLYLIYIELFEVEAICLWCTGVHLCTFALFGLVLWNTIGAHNSTRVST